VGDVQVFIPVDLPLNIEAVIDEAAGHKVLSDFPLTVNGTRRGEDEEDFGPRTVRAKGALNGGGKELVIHTVTGNIEIHKLDSGALNELKTRQQAYWSNWQSRENTRLDQELRKVQRKVQLQMERQQRELERQQRELQKRLQQEVEDHDED
jgi:hypothetical protein